ncbi:MAG: hypothetical protein QM752_07635 [Gammaproteobacteria bacterium]
MTAKKAVLNPNNGLRLNRGLIAVSPYICLNVPYIGMCLALYQHVPCIGSSGLLWFRVFFPAMAHYAPLRCALLAFKNTLNHSNPEEALLSAKLNFALVLVLALFFGQETIAYYLHHL